MNIFQQIRQDAFYNELEKDASLKSKLVGAGLIGAMGISGLGIGSIGGMVSGANQANKGFNLTKQEHVVPTTEFVKRHAPNINLLNQNSIDTAQGMNKFQRSVVKQELKRGNMFYQTARLGKNPARIIAPDSASPTLLSHEIGHHLDRQAHPGWRPGIVREYSAWKMAPKIQSGAGLQIKKRMFGSYVHQAVGQGVGSIGGLLFGGLSLGLLKKRRRII